jgi:hypothetical protein
MAFADMNVSSGSAAESYGGRVVASRWPKYCAVTMSFLQHIGKMMSYSMYNIK